MSAWLAAAIALGAALVPLAAVAVRGSAVEGVVALELAGLIGSLGLMVLAEAFRRQSLADLGLVLAVMSFAGALVFLRYFERRRGP
jgi:multisubunit Na+/H+ antiporter MnhF subunit